MKWFLTRIDLHIVYASAIVLLIVLGLRGVPSDRREGLFSIGILVSGFLFGQHLVWDRNTGGGRPPVWSTIIVNEILVFGFSGLNCLLLWH